MNLPETTDEKQRLTKRWSQGAVKAAEGAGCLFNCLYCNQRSLDIGKNGKKESGYIYSGIDGGVSINNITMIGNEVASKVSNDIIFSELKKYPYYTKKTNILVKNYTDPGLDWEDSIEIGLRLVKEFKHEGAIIFITKAEITREQSKKMAVIMEEGGRPVVIVTYSGLPSKIEPVSAEGRIKTIKRLGEVGVPTILSMRPMIVGINTDSKTIKNVLKVAGNYSNKITVGGLYVYPDTIERFKKAGFELDVIYQQQKYRIAKQLPESVIKNIREIAKKLKITQEIYSHTTCAISDILTVCYGVKTPDPLAHWSCPDKTDFDSCNKFCNKTQMNECIICSQEKSSKKIKEAEKVLRKIGYSNKIINSDVQRGLLLVTGASLSVADLFTISRQCNWKVDNLPTKEQFDYRCLQAVTKDLGYPKEKYIGSFLEGQEWYVFVDGQLGEASNNFLTLKWIRNRNRCRVPKVIDANQFSSQDAILTLAEEISNKSRKSSMTDLYYQISSLVLNFMEEKRR